jgi:hypothetical protein
MHLPLRLSLPLHEKKIERHNKSPVAGTSTATHAFHFLPDYDVKELLLAQS